MLVENMEKKIQTKFKSENESFEDRVRKKGTYLVVVANEPCFTCGRKKQLVRPERTDGRVDIIRECLYCMVRVPTAANRRES
jgi:hypothetical protein